MGKIVVAIHTAFSTVDMIRQEMQNAFPEIKLKNIVNEGLLDLAIADNGNLSKPHIRCFCEQAHIAEEIGADAILCACSSVGDAVELAKGLSNIPLYRIDEPMMCKAVEDGNRIGIIATLTSTLNPSGRLLSGIANERDKKVHINKYYCENALKALNEEKNKQKYERIVIEMVEKASEENDVLVLAQASMYSLLPLLENAKCPVLSSLPDGVRQIKL